MGDPMRSRSRLECALTVLLIVTALDLTYLTWRFTALYAGWVTPGTGLCSWSARVDCDQVLRTPQARTFYIPNAVVGLGFYAGILWWWLLGLRLGPDYRALVVRVLTAWLAIASLLTLWFWYLLVNLPHLCPFCPWNHILTVIELIVAAALWRLTPRPVAWPPLRPLVLPAVTFIGFFWLCQLAWVVLEESGLLRNAG